MLGISAQEINLNLPQQYLKPPDTTKYTQCRTIKENHRLLCLQVTSIATLQKPSVYL